MSLCVCSAIILLAQRILIDIHCTFPLADTLTSLQPRREEACQYEAEPLL